MEIKPPTANCRHPMYEPLVKDGHLTRGRRMMCEHCVVATADELTLSPSCERAYPERYFTARECAVEKMVSLKGRPLTAYELASMERYVIENRYEWSDLC